MTAKSDFLLKLWHFICVTVNFGLEVYDMLRDAGVLLIRLAEITIVVAAVGYVDSKSPTPTIATWYITVKIAAILCTQREMRKLIKLHISKHGSSIISMPLPYAIATIFIFAGAVLWYLHVVPQALDALIATQRGAMF